MNYQNKIKLFTIISLIAISTIGLTIIDTSASTDADTTNDCNMVWHKGTNLGTLFATPGSSFDFTSDTWDLPQIFFETNSEWFQISQFPDESGYHYVFKISGTAPSEIGKRSTLLNFTSPDGSGTLNLTTVITPIPDGFKGMVAYDLEPMDDENHVRALINDAKSLPYSITGRSFSVSIIVSQQEFPLIPGQIEVIKNQAVSMCRGALYEPHIIPDFCEMTSWVVCGQVSAKGGYVISGTVPEGQTLTITRDLTFELTASHTVYYDENGGSAVASQTVTEGSKLSVPSQPTKNNYVFSGWYKESTYATAWDFATDTVTSDITLYAKWTEVLVFVNTPSAVANVTLVATIGNSVVFDASGSADYTSVLWDFGDGNTSTQLIAQHEYDEPGTYEYTLTVTSALGSDTTTGSISVNGDEDGEGFSLSATDAVLIVLIVILAIVVITRVI